MAVDYDSFLNWATDRFGESNIKFRKGGREICTHSFFVDGHPDFPDGDHKFKLWMNPDGGKNELEGGAYRCWYTDHMGSLISLVSIVDKVPYDVAADIICDEIPLRALEKKVHDFYSVKQDDPQETIEEIKQELEFPPDTYKIEEVRGHWMGARALEYLASRKIPSQGFYVCIDGDYRNRLVIPYYNKAGELFYYNCRTLDKNPKTLRYMKPPPEDADQENVLYFPEWPAAGSKIYITEGEFDAFTLWLSGFYGVACGGKFLSSSQIEMIRDYKVVLAFDSDDAGEQALLNIGETLLADGFQDMQYVRPPKVFKDWNKLLEQRNIDTLKAYIQRFEKPYNSWTVNSLTAKRL